MFSRRYLREYILDCCSHAEAIAITSDVPLYLTAMRSIRNLFPSREIVFIVWRRHYLFWKPEKILQQLFSAAWIVMKNNFRYKTLIMVKTFMSYFFLQLIKSRYDIFNRILLLSFSYSNILLIWHGKILDFLNYLRNDLKDLKIYLLVKWLNFCWIFIIPPPKKISHIMKFYSFKIQHHKITISFLHLPNWALLRKTIDVVC